MITKDKSRKKSFELKTNIHQRLIEDHLQESLTFLMLQIVTNVSTRYLTQYRYLSSGTR
jgi:hypothetical protein